jgi:hypothetical protein
LPAGSENQAGEHQDYEKLVQSGFLHLDFLLPIMKNLELTVKVDLSLLIKPAGQDFSSPTSSFIAAICVHS